jgi:hypothetical protein
MWGEQSKVSLMNAQKLIDYVTEKNRTCIDWGKQEPSTNKWECIKVEKIGRCSLSNMTSLLGSLLVEEQEAWALLSQIAETWPRFLAHPWLVLLSLLLLTFTQHLQYKTEMERWKQGCSMAMLPRCPSIKDWIPTLLAKYAR